MLPTIPVKEMTVTSGPEHVRVHDVPDVGRWYGTRHTALDVQAGKDFKNPQGETARHGLGEPVRSPIEGKIIRVDEKTNGLIIADKDGNVIGVRHMKLANNPRDKDGNPLKPEDAHKQRVWKTGDAVKVGDTLGFINNIGAEDDEEKTKIKKGETVKDTEKKNIHVHLEVGPRKKNADDLDKQDPYNPVNFAAGEVMKKIYDKHVKPAKAEEEKKAKPAQEQTSEAPSSEPERVPRPRLEPVRKKLNQNLNRPNLHPETPQRAYRPGLNLSQLLAATHRTHPPRNPGKPRHQRKS